jgi:hypothetical protein
MTVLMSYVWLPELSTFHLRLNYRYRKMILVRLLVKKMDKCIR